MTEDNALTTMDANLNPVNAFKFRLDDQEMIGHITGLSFPVGTTKTDLKGDIPVANPTNPSSKVEVIGVIEDVKWNGGQTDALVVGMRVSPTNKGKIAAAFGPEGGADVDVQFDLYEYDHNGNKYFPALSSDNKMLQCKITQGTKVKVGNKKETDVEQPVNFRVELSMTPKPSNGDQNMKVATSLTDKFMRQFGIPVQAG
jgi:hypothetical protein